MSVSEHIVEAEIEELTARQSWWQKLVHLIRRQPLAAFGAALVMVMVFLAAFADVVSPFDPTDANYDEMFRAPAADYWFGTDHFGRDILSRIIHGSRTALFVGIIAAFSGATIGLVLGVASAYFSGTFDLLFQRVMDVFLSFPLIIMALAVVSIFGTDLIYVIIAITLPFVPNCARIVRSNALAIREIPYIDAARALGFSHTRIILRHMVPNVMAPFLIVLTGNVGEAILLEASLSYLGLGVQEPTPAWGMMLQGGAEEYAESAPWVPIFPGLAITIAVFGFNLFGDGLRDILDPRLRRQ